jgi:2'-5' RNA ligase
VAEHVDDPRHRFSYELRPDGELDASIRALASQLEADGLLPAGAATAPRFHPHLTLLRADRADPKLIQQVASQLRPHAALELATVGSFGGGRIAWCAPARTTPLEHARIRLVAALGEQHVDPLALARSPWVPHVTVAYAVDEPHRAAVLERIAAALPLSGRWHVAQAWDLGVRPTRCVVHAAVST